MHITAVLEDSDYKDIKTYRKTQDDQAVKIYQNWRIREECIVI